MSDFPCFKCGAEVEPKKAVHTTDGKIACQKCARKLGIRTIPRIGFDEVARMRERSVVEAEKVKVDDMAADEKVESDDLAHLTTISDTLDWVLGEQNVSPSKGMSE